MDKKDNSSVPDTKNQEIKKEKIIDIAGNDVTDYVYLSNLTFDPKTNKIINVLFNDHDIINN